MSEGLNRVILIGNIGQTPELKSTQGGKSVMTIRLATSENWIQGTERKEHTEWHTVIVWGKRAEGLAKILTKGFRIGVEGKLRTRAWGAKDGSKRYSTEVVADNLILLGSSQKSEPRKEIDCVPDQSMASNSSDDFPADDLPF